MSPLPLRAVLNLRRPAGSLLAEHVGHPVDSVHLAYMGFLVDNVRLVYTGCCYMEAGMLEAQSAVVVLVQT